MPRPAETSVSLVREDGQAVGVLLVVEEVPDRDAAAAFVAKCHDADSGGFSDEPGGKPAVFPTSVAAMAVVSLKMPAEKYEAEPTGEPGLTSTCATAGISWSIERSTE